MSFHAPNEFRDRTHPTLGTEDHYGNNGAFHMPSCEPGWELAVICSDGGGWEHVSVHAYQGDGRKQRTPSWKEMAHVKRLFWDGDDVTVQYYPRESDYVNNHQHTLHWWRPIDREIPTPPSAFVGLKSIGVL